MKIPSGIKDCRADFAARFHSLGSSTDKDGLAQRWLLDNNSIAAPPELPMEPRKYPRIDTSSGTLSRPGDSRRVPNLLVPGLLGDSVRTVVAPMAFAEKTLELDGYAIDVLWVNGRQGCDKNAAALYPQVMDAAQRHGSAVRLIGYSKGCTDAMHLLANHTDCHDVIDSVVSLAGVVHGTPLAARTATWLDRLVQYLPLPGVEFGDGRALDDLAPEFRRHWLSDHPLPPSIRYASVLAVPEPDRISKLLKSSYRRLAKISVDNDSQVLATDSLLPDSELLAMVNADHWAIALPIGRTLPFLSRWLIDENDFPRPRLLQAIIDHMDDAPGVPAVSD